MFLMSARVMVLLVYQEISNRYMSSAGRIFNIEAKHGAAVIFYLIKTT